ncbi:SDR family oxidoreductase [Lachnospiraceae bacterium MD335]|nr:SDR family oxidoreductase [Lachnospiraceae bacterium MD335]
MNKKIVITGSTYGIGASLGLYLLRNGATVVFNYTKDDCAAKILKEKATEIKNGKFFIMRADVSKLEEVQEFVKNVIETVGVPDIIINNAAIVKSKHLIAMSQNDWNSVLNVNLNGVFYCSKLFTKEMIREKQGKIIVIGSLTGETGMKGNSNYTASKAALMGFVRSAAIDLECFNISINLVYPPAISTNLNQIIRNNNLQEKNLDAFNNFLVYMCSDKFHSISGQVFCLNNRIWERD